MLLKVGAALMFDSLVLATAVVAVVALRSEDPENARISGRRREDSYREGRGEKVRPRLEA